MKRDLEVQEQLRSLGWKVEIVWECETKNIDLLLERLDKIFKN